MPSSFSSLPHNSPSCSPLNICFLILLLIYLSSHFWKGKEWGVSRMGSFFPFSQPSCLCWCLPGTLPPLLLLLSAHHLSGHCNGWRADPGGPQCLWKRGLTPEPIAVEDKWWPHRVAGGAPFDLSSTFLLVFSAPQLPTGMWSLSWSWMFDGPHLSTSWMWEWRRKRPAIKGLHGGRRSFKALFSKRGDSLLFFPIHWLVECMWAGECGGTLGRCWPAQRIWWASTRLFNYLQNIYI